VISYSHSGNCKAEQSRGGFNQSFGILGTIINRNRTKSKLEPLALDDERFTGQRPIRQTEVT